MMKILKEKSAEELSNYSLTKFVDSQKFPSLIGFNSKPNRYSFKILKETYPEISYYGRLRVTSKVSEKLKFKVDHENYGSRFMRTKPAGVLFGSFSASIACMDIFVSDN